MAPLSAKNSKKAKNKTCYKIFQKILVTLGNETSTTN